MWGGRLWQLVDHRSVTGGGTNFSIANKLGSGRTDLFQAGPAELDRDALPFGEAGQRPRALPTNQLGQYCCPLRGRRSISNLKNKTALAIATVAAIRRNDCDLPDLHAQFERQDFALSRVSVRRRLIGVI